MTSIEHASLLLGMSLTAGALAWAAVSDFTRYLIPNRVCFLIAGGYLLAAPGMPLSQWLSGLAIGVLTFGLGFALFARGWLGGGDVKLAAAVNLWAGTAYLTDFVVATSAAGLAVGLVMLSPVRQVMPRPAWPAPASEGLQQPMPFGVALAAGGLFVLARRLMVMA